MATVDFESAAGKQLLKNLYVYSRGLYRQLYNTEVNARGKSYEDYVEEAIEKHLKGTDNYSPDRGPVEPFLKFLVIKRQIINDLPPHVKEEYKRARSQTSEETEMVHKTPVPGQQTEPTASSEDFDFPEHDRELIFREIEKEIEGDDVVERIYLAVAHDKFHISDRKEICEEQDIIPSDFDNGRRRLVTVLKKVFRKIGLISRKDEHI